MRFTPAAARVSANWSATVLAMGCLLDQVLGAGLRREVVTEFGVCQPYEGEGAFGGGLALEVDRPEFGHDPMGVDPRGGDRTLKARHDPGDRAFRRCRSAGDDRLAALG